MNIRKIVLILSILLNFINIFAKKSHLFIGQLLNVNLIIKKLNLSYEESITLKAIQKMFLEKFRKLNRKIIEYYKQLRILLATNNIDIKKFEEIKKKIIDIEKQLMDYSLIYYKKVYDALSKEHRKLLKRLLSQ